VREPPAIARAASDAYMRRDVIFVSLEFIAVPRLRLRRVTLMKHR
jgi:hypothetical protein